MANISKSAVSAEREAVAQNIQNLEAQLTQLQQQMQQVHQNLLANRGALVALDRMLFLADEKDPAPEVEAVAAIPAEPAS